MEFDVYTYTVAGTYASAIINNDYSGLSDAETEALNTWINDHVPPGAGHFDGFDEDDSKGFTRDDVSGPLADCFAVRWYKPKKEIK